MKQFRVMSAAIALLTSFSGISAAQSEPRFYSPQDRAPNNDVPDVRVWLEDPTFIYGDLIRPFVVADDGAYVTVFRVTTDGELKVLYPSRPDRQEMYSRDRFANDRIPINGANAFYASEGLGSGFVFAVASYYPFNYNYYSSRDGQWSLARLASAKRFGSPFQIVRSFVEEITGGSELYSMDYVVYDVNSNQYRSRYATRYRGYTYNDYYDLCLNAFGYYYTDYCRGYYRGFNGPGVVVIRPGNGNLPRGTPAQATGRTLKMRPLVVDPLVNPIPDRAAVTQGTVLENDARERAAIARHERMLREAQPRVNPMVPQRNQPEQEPRIYRPQEPVTRSAPRADVPRGDIPRPAPRIEAPRQMPQPQARIEVPRESHPAPKVEKQKDN